MGPLNEHRVPFIQFVQFVVCVCSSSFNVSANESTNNNNNQFCLTWLLSVSLLIPCQCQLCVLFAFALLGVIISWRHSSLAPFCIIEHVIHCFCRLIKTTHTHTHTHTRAIKHKLNMFCDEKSSVAVFVPETVFPPRNVISFSHLCYIYMFTVLCSNLSYYIDIDKL